ncbi:MAG: LPS export ABC transporter periplasmic protein LptC [Acidobacteriia bacterium]|nr:LPS export ABC transporter periplasmic protein LptC [Terriglobia bacterium]
MAFDLQRLRKWLGIGIVAVIAVVALFVLYGRYRIRRAVQELPQKMGVDVKQSTEGFTLSKSEGGRTLFTISAKKAVQYEQGGRAELHGVNIVVYGREADRFDQIYGADFSYNPSSGDIQAKGEVHIDLESDTSGPVRPDQAPPKELKNPIHLKTSGVVFNQKTGFAATNELIDFRVPQATGTAKGATYDSKNNVLVLRSAVRLRTAGPESANITAERGIISKDPRRAVLDVVHLERANGSLDAGQVTVFLRDDNSVDHMVATGDVRARGRQNSTVRAPRAEAFMSANLLRHAVLSGGVTFDQGGPSPSHGTAGRILLDFGPHDQLANIRAVDKVSLTEQQKSSGHSPQVVEIAAPAISSSVSGGKMGRAQTSGASQISIRPLDPIPAHPTDADATTVITAGQFDLVFEGNHMKQLHGSPDARIVSSVPGQPDKVSTSRDLTAAFDAGGGISSLLQVGDVHYIEGQRTATAQRARYSPGDGVLVLTGAPRVSEGGLQTTAQTIRFERRSGDATAEGDVKTTYNEPRQQPGGAPPAAGAMFSSGDPIHVTAASMLAHRATATARYTGGARLWQGANIVQAPVITFDRDHHDVLAQGSASQAVSTVFVQTDKSGKLTPVNVNASRLTYTEALRKARFEGGVIVKGADLTVQADHADVFLLPRAAKTQAAGPSGVSQVEHMVAEGHIAITESTRTARGERLTYNPADGKFVLTGGPPSIFDAEHGTISGDSLTFFSRDDKVVVGSSGSSRTVTQTRVTK